MAEWQKVELADSGTLKQLAELGEEGIESVTEALKVVQVAGEAAKIFLLSTVNPALLALIVIADAMIDTLQNFRESGVFVIQVNPFQQPYGAKNGVPIGLKMETDSENKVLFLSSRVNNIKDASYGEIFTPNDKYRETLNLKDLVGYKDVNGKNKSWTGDKRDPADPNYDPSPPFIPPMPVLSKDLKLVEGGYDPATWNGTKPTIPMTDFGVPLPEFPAPDCIELLAAAFEDEGDVSRYKIDPTRSKDAYTYRGDKVTFTDSTAADYFDPTTLIGQELYDKADTSLSASDRKPITNLISSGKPNYHGNTQLFGVEVKALAIVVASENPTEWVKSIQAILNLFGPGFEKFKQQMADYAAQLDEKSRSKDTIRVRVDSKFGGGAFQIGDFVIGKKSGYIGKIDEIDSGSKSVIKTTEYSTNAKGASMFMSAQPATEVFKKVKDLNADGRFEDTKIVVRDYNGKTITRAFEVGEPIVEAEAYTKKNSEDKDEVAYRERYSFDNLAASVLGGGYAQTIPDDRKPKQGFILNQIPSVPDSVTPDFISLKLADMIPGYGAFFDNMINIAESIKAFAEGVLEAIQVIIDAIDDIVEYFEEIAENIIALIRLLTQGLPNAGIWLMGMTSQSGSDKFAAALRSAGNAPGESYKISAGFCFVGAPWLDPDPVKVLFGDILGVKYESVDGASGPSAEQLAYDLGLT